MSVSAYVCVSWCVGVSVCLCVWKPLTGGRGFSDVLLPKQVLGVIPAAGGAGGAEEKGRDRGGGCCLGEREREREEKAMREELQSCKRELLLLQEVQTKQSLSLSLSLSLSVDLSVWVCVCVCACADGVEAGCRAGVCCCSFSRL